VDEHDPEKAREKQKDYNTKTGRTDPNVPIVTKK
jgi:hypothetical protein